MIHAIVTSLGSLLQVLRDADFARDLYDRIGFDTVDVSPLSESWRVERDRPAYVVKQTKAELEANLAKATRTV
jgi:predicted dinucleotide-binding enzyme